MLKYVYKINRNGGKATMTVYISGPVTGVKDYEKTFSIAQEAIKAKGHNVVSPITIEVLQQSQFSWSDAMKICIALMEKCDCVVFLPNWGASVGARIEHA